MLGGGDGEEVSPLENFSKPTLMQATGNGADGSFGADDEEFDGFLVWLRVAVELEGEFDTDGFRGLRGTSTLPSTRDQGQRKVGGKLSL